MEYSYPGSGAWSSRTRPIRFLSDKPTFSSPFPRQSLERLLFLTSVIGAHSQIRQNTSECLPACISHQLFATDGFVS
jgi:hypothetical protein